MADERRMDMKHIISNFPTREEIADIVARLRDLTGTLPSKSELAKAVGLQSRGGFGRDVLLPLTMFGGGLLVGAALALLFAPKAGPELREDPGPGADELHDEHIGSEGGSLMSTGVPAS